MSDEGRGGTSLEDTAISVLRKARFTCEHMGQAGIRFAALADWLEVQVPAIGDRCRRVVRTVLKEASGQGEGD
jgi:hypothetical protein